MQGVSSFAKTQNTIQKRPLPRVVATPYTKPVVFGQSEPDDSKKATNKGLGFGIQKTLAILAIATPLLAACGIGGVSPSPSGTATSGSATSSTQATERNSSQGSGIPVLLQVTPGKPTTPEPEPTPMPTETPTVLPSPTPVPPTATPTPDPSALTEQEAKRLFFYTEYFGKRQKISNYLALGNAAKDILKESIVVARSYDLDEATLIAPMVTNQWNFAQGSDDRLGIYFLDAGQRLRLVQQLGYPNNEQHLLRYDLTGADGNPSLIDAARRSVHAAALLIVQDRKNGQPANPMDEANRLVPPPTRVKKDWFGEQMSSVDIVFDDIHEQVRNSGLE